MLNKAPLQSMTEMVLSIIKIGDEFKQTIKIWQWLKIEFIFS